MDVQRLKGKKYVVYEGICALHKVEVKCSYVLFFMG